MKRPTEQHGFSHILIPLIVIVLAVIGFVGWRVLSRKDAASGANGAAKAQDDRVIWTYHNKWKPSKTPPACHTPILDNSPVDIKMVTAILYPGQTRGQYKAHGGFHFSNNKTNNVTVTMPIDGYITGATRYYQTNDNGVDELQYLVTFVNDCGISIKFDHLYTLSPEVQAIMDKQPAAKLNDTSGMPLTNGALFKKGAVIATAIGFKSNMNVGMDFGVYDYRQPNAASKDPAYAAAHATGDYENFYAVCWLDDLPAADAAIAKSLPGGDGKVGKTSDYCK